MTPTHEVNNGTNATEGPQYSIGEAGEVFKLMMSLIPGRLARRPSLRAGAGNDGATTDGGRAFDATHDGPPDVGPAADAFPERPRVTPATVDAAISNTLSGEGWEAREAAEAAEGEPVGTHVDTVIPVLSPDDRGGGATEAIDSADGVRTYLGEGYFTLALRAAIGWLEQAQARPLTPRFPPGKTPPEFRGRLLHFVSDEAELIRIARLCPDVAWQVNDTDLVFDPGRSPLGPNIHWGQFEDRVKQAELLNRGARAGVPLPGEEARDEIVLTGMAAWTPKPVDYLVDELLVRGQPGILGAPSKSAKTLVAVALAVHGATATPVFGHEWFAVRKPFRTLLMSMESGDASLHATTTAVAASLGASLADLDGRIFVSTARQQINGPAALENLRRAVLNHGIELLIVDPLSVALGLPQDAMQNIAVMYRALDPLAKLCDETGCTLLLVHHTIKSKAKSFARTDLVDLNGAGLDAWARQWLLLSRRTAYDAAAAKGRHELHLHFGGSAGHSGGVALDIEEFDPADPDRRARKWSAAVVTAAAPAAADKAEAARRADEAARERLRDQRRKVEILRLLVSGGPKTVNACRVLPSGEISRARAEMTIEWLVQHGLVAEAAEKGHKGAVRWEITDEGKDHLRTYTEGEPGPLPRGLVETIERRKAARGGEGQAGAGVAVDPEEADEADDPSRTASG